MYIVCSWVTIVHLSRLWLVKPNSILNSHVRLRPEACWSHSTFAYERLIWQEEPFTGDGKAAFRS